VHDLIKEFRRPVVFAGQLVFQRENVFTRSLHTRLVLDPTPAAVHRHPGDHPAIRVWSISAARDPDDLRGAPCTDRFERQARLVMGVANHRSLSWRSPRASTRRGEPVPHLRRERSSHGRRAGGDRPGTLVLECDVTRDDTIDAVARRLTTNGIGRSPGARHRLRRKEDLEGEFVATPREDSRWRLR